MSSATRLHLDAVNGREPDVPCTLVVRPISVEPAEGRMLRVRVMAKIVLNFLHGDIILLHIEVVLCGVAPGDVTRTSFEILFEIQKVCDATGCRGLDVGDLPPLLTVHPLLPHAFEITDVAALAHPFDGNVMYPQPAAGRNLLQL